MRSLHAQWLASAPLACRLPRPPPAGRPSPQLYPLRPPPPLYRPDRLRARRPWRRRRSFLWIRSRTTRRERYNISRRQPQAPCRCSSTPLTAQRTTPTGRTGRRTRYNRRTGGPCAYARVPLRSALAAHLNRSFGAAVGAALCAALRTTLDSSGRVWRRSSTTRTRRSRSSLRARRRRGCRWHSVHWSTLHVALVYVALVYVARCIGLRCTLHWSTLHVALVYVACCIGLHCIGLRCTTHVARCKVYYCLLHVAPSMLHGPCCMSHAACRTLGVASWAVGEARPQEEKDAQLARELSDEYHREEHADAEFARQLQARAPHRSYRVLNPEYPLSNPLSAP
jgi:hypothetical protein